MLTLSDENREIVVSANYTLPIIRHILCPELAHVAIPVIYNLCVDFGNSTFTKACIVINIYSPRSSSGH